MPSSGDATGGLRRGAATAFHIPATVSVTTREAPAADEAQESRVPVAGPSLGLAKREHGYRAGISLGSAREMVEAMRERNAPHRAEVQRRVASFRRIAEQLRAASR